ncbi:hypothetical protein MF672_014000 [Actinomadura sp. ATCC 31491]|uniref:Uncharacterized protein n=1 Tax=Actinomadura luzonensis TaxID=2805427 RepID=A0ABT0FRW2_9ACTN|nr:hypothetical protein [Actinomadura luzonensis]MCK2214893.1 hypothetical protein [Actinomadura luzonensis]
MIVMEPCQPRDRYSPRQLLHRFDKRDQRPMARLRHDEQEMGRTIAEARRAYQEGREVFVFRLRVKPERMRAWAVPEAPELIEGVEREGWYLSHVSESLIGDAHPLMTCILRRRR